MVNILKLFSGKCVEFEGKEKINVNYTFDGTEFTEIDLKDNFGLIYQKQCDALNLLDHITYPDESWFIWKVCL